MGATAGILTALRSYSTCLFSLWKLFPIKQTCGQKQEDVLGLRFSNSAGSTSAQWPDLLRTARRVVDRLHRGTILCYTRLDGILSFVVSILILHQDAENPPNQPPRPQPSPQSHPQKEPQEAQGRLARVRPATNRNRKNQAGICQRRTQTPARRLDCRPSRPETQRRRESRYIRGCECSACARSRDSQTSIEGTERKRF